MTNDEYDAWLKAWLQQLADAQQRRAGLRLVARNDVSWPEDRHFIGDWQDTDTDKSEL